VAPYVNAVILPLEGHGRRYVHTQKRSPKGGNPGGSKGNVWLALEFYANRPPRGKGVVNNPTIPPQVPARLSLPAK